MSPNMGVANCTDNGTATMIANSHNLRKETGGADGDVG